VTQLALFEGGVTEPRSNHEVRNLGDAPKKGDSALLRLVRRLSRHMLEWPFDARVNHLVAWKALHELAGLSPLEARSIDWRAFAAEQREPAGHVETSAEMMRRAGWIEETPEGWRMRRPEEWRGIDEPADPENISIPRPDNCTLP
jgi:hypothetical protein